MTTSATYRECGQRVHDRTHGWYRCVLAYDHDGNHADEIDTTEETARRGSWVRLVEGN